MSPERNVDIRHVSRENIRRDPRRLVAREQNTPDTITKVILHPQSAVVVLN
jgi:hypothetical protein